MIFILHSLSLPHIQSVFHHHGKSSKPSHYTKMLSRFHRTRWELIFRVWRRAFNGIEKWFKMCVIFQLLGIHFVPPNDKFSLGALMKISATEFHHKVVTKIASIAIFLIPRIINQTKSWVLHLYCKWIVNTESFVIFSRWLEIKIATPAAQPTILFRMQAAQENGD